MSKRECGPCTLCCKLLAVQELQKPVGKYCKHAKFGCGCQIYADRPSTCQSFECLWVADDEAIPVKFHPSVYKFFFYMTKNQDGVILYCDYNFELKPELKQYLRHINKHLGVIFVKGSQRTYNPPGTL